MERSEAVAELKGLLEGREVPDEARACEAVVADLLRGQGWTVEQQRSVPHRGGGKSGRVDLVATKGGQQAGIEIDRRAPRRKSVIKLRCRDWIRCIALRQPGWDFWTPPDLVVIHMRTESFGNG